MADEQALVTVFRSPYHDARDEAERVREMLLDAGIAAVVAGDDTPGVVSGTYEVRVPPNDVELAEKIVEVEEKEGEEQNDAPVPVDPSHSLDLETVFRSCGATAELEAITIQSVLEANGLAPVLVGASTIPSLEFDVRVPRDQVVRAGQLISEAQSAGPQAAEEAEEAEEAESGGEEQQ